MAINDIKTFSYTTGGLTLEVTATDLGNGKTSFTVTSLDGSADVNALYWNDGVDDLISFNLGGALNMNGSGEDWDGAVKLSDAGLGKLGEAKPTYLTVGDGGYTKIADVNWATLDTIGIRATSTSTEGGSIKGIAEQPHLGESLFVENFDGYDSSVQKTYQDNGVDVFASVNLNTASGWTGSANGGAANSELGADGYGGITATSPAPDGTGGFWLDTQNTPGQINISHTFDDTTAAVGGKTAVLSFDIAKQDLVYQGIAYQTEDDASFAFQIDGVTVKTILASDLAADNTMYHFEVDIAGYAAAGDVHTLTLVDTSPQSDVTGFSVDSIQINDWVV